MNLKLRCRAYVQFPGKNILDKKVLTRFKFHRVKEYCAVEPEEKPDEYEKIGHHSTNPESILPKEWPRSGEVEFRNVTIKYDLDGPEILKNINLKFAAGERVAIVGRTGSGKSTVSGTPRLKTIRY